MRTTVDIKPEHRNALLALAVRRGKRFSSVLTEAIEQYLNDERMQVRRRKELLSLAGVLSAKEAMSLRRAVTSLRENWS
jgi:hypothetical protein